MDFYTISQKQLKSGEIQLYPDFVVGRAKDLMVRGQAFYAVWDEERGLWSTDEYDVQRLVDEHLHRYAAEHPEENYTVMNLKSFNTKVWTTFRTYMRNISDNHHHRHPSRSIRPSGPQERSGIQATRTPGSGTDVPEP